MHFFFLQMDAIYIWQTQNQDNLLNMITLIKEQTAGQILLHGGAFLTSLLPNGSHLEFLALENYINATISLNNQCGKWHMPWAHINGKFIKSKLP